MSNENWRAKCDGHEHVLVRIHGAASNMEHGMSVGIATTLRDELTAAIEEAKRLADPFERWVGTLPGSHGSYRVGKCWCLRADLRAIYDSIEAARKEQP